MSKRIVIVRGDGRFFSGNWSRISWTAEYPNARIYQSAGAALREARRLRWEDPISEAIRVISNYGLKTEREEAQRQAIPPCALAMGCLCAGHARGNAAEAACNTEESV